MANEGMHYSVRDAAGNVWACYSYEVVATNVAIRESLGGARTLHVEHVKDCDCKHGHQ